MKLLRKIWFWQDISIFHEPYMEQALALKEQEYHTLRENIPDLIVHINIPNEQALL